MIEVDYQQEFLRMMQTQKALALATVCEGKPNVRIVNFYYDSVQKTAYFSSFADNKKVTELAQNPIVSFTTLPENGEEHVRVTQVLAQPASVPIDAVKEKFLDKLPDYIMGIDAVLPELVLFEMRLIQAEVVLDFEHMESIVL